MASSCGLAGGAEWLADLRTPITQQTPNVGPMNDAHLQFLASPEWAQMLETELLPWLLESADLGDDVLEVGPGPGLTTDQLMALLRGEPE